MKRLPTQKHMTLEARKYIEEALNEKKSISQIARDLDRSETTIAREIKKHRQPMFPTAFNNNSGCLLHQSCSHKHFECYLHCKNFQMKCVSCLQNLHIHAMLAIKNVSADWLNIIIRALKQIWNTNLY